MAYDERLQLRSPAVHLLDHRYLHQPSFGSPGPSRRPLPTPRSRPESMPPPPRQSPLVVQAPAPSRPAILAPSAALPNSPTAPPARRPLPTPVLSPPKPVTKHSSLDLTARPASPVKSAINTISTDPDRDLRIPSSFSRRTAPLPDTVPPALPNPHPDVHAPLWNRNVPSVPASTVIERRSTVSGVFPPAALQPRSNPPRTQSPHHPLAQRLHASPTRRPLPSSPTEPPRVPPFHERIPAASEDGHDMSSPSDESSVPDPSSYEPMTFADPQAEDDQDGEIVLSTDTSNSSPKYGIRDLPARAWIAIANRDNQTPVVTATTQHEEVTRQRPVRSATLPQPPPPESQPPIPGLPQTRAPASPPVSATFPGRIPPPTLSASEPQSLTLRFATMGLAEERAREKEKQMSSPSPAQSPTRAAPGPTSPVRQQHAWPSNVPPLPRTPASTTRPVFGAADLTIKSQSFKPNGTSSPSLPTSPTHSARPLSSSPGPQATFDRKSVAQQHQSQSQQIPQLTARQLEKQRARDTDINLDDAPPPSLRRSPSPIRQGFARTPAIEITNDTPPRRQWTPGQDVTSRIGNASVNGTGGPYSGLRAASRSPERGGQPLPQPRTQPLAQPPTQSQQTVIPRISLPDRNHDDGSVADDSDGLGPSTVISGPGSGPSISVSPPSISISETPSVVVSERAVPAISVSAAPLSFSPPKISVSDSAHTQRSAPSPGNFGSRHTQIQESSPLHAPPSRGAGSKRGLPSLPSSSNPVRTNGLSCGGCNGPIVGRIVSAMGQRWHPNCFRCSICNELLEHVSSYERDGKPYCHLDYHETFAPRCFHCKTAIIDERFITLDDPALGKRTYHEQHFFCAECGDPFLAPSGALPASATRTGELNLSGDGEFVDDDVGFTVYKGHPYCEACHVRLRMPKCKSCKKSIRDGVRAVEALGGKWCWGCFVCESCKKPFEDPAFFLRNEKPFCEPCFSLILRNEV